MFAYILKLIAVCNKTLSIIILILLFTSININAQNQIDESVSYRKSMMTAIGGHLGAVAHIIRGQLTEFQPHLEKQSLLMLQTFQLVPSTFMENTRRAQSYSKQEIWDQPQKFKQALIATENALIELNKVSRKHDWKILAKQLNRVRKTCKDCHKNFRIKKR